jgi:nicotinamidase-related amidase
MSSDARVDELEPVESLAAPRRCALVVVDMQNDNASTEGLIARSGGSVEWARKIVPHVAALIEAARASAIPIVFTRNTYSPALRVDAPGRLRLLQRKAYLRDGSGATHASGYQIEGSFGHAILSDLDARESDAQISKYRSSAFHGTPLDFVLRGNGVETVVLAGVVTEGCIESTARDAESHGYYPVVVADAVATSDPALHSAAMTIMRARYDVVDASLLTSIWSSAAG